MTQKGFTVIELLWILGITAIILGFMTINLISASQSSSLNANTSTLLTDIKQQQLKAMMGDIQKEATPSSYGVHFDQTQYVLFKGDSYSGGSLGNMVIPLNGSLQFATPGADLIFSQLTGELSVASSQAILDPNSKGRRTFNINRYGVVTEIN